MRKVVLDTETTGLDPGMGHRVIEIGAVEILNRRVTGEVFHVYLNPERDIDPGALEVHGLTGEFLQDKPVFREVGQEFLRFVEDAELVIHNAAFDVGFLDAELARLDAGAVRGHCKGVTDTLRMARELHPGQKNNLDALCKRYEVDNSGRSFHGALLDAQLLAEVYLAMTRGQESLAIEPAILPTGHRIRPDTAVEIRVLPTAGPELAAHVAYLKAMAEDGADVPAW
jgi:DNA polymerase III subunit epsilon